MANKKQTDKKPRGRPPAYTNDLADVICGHIADGKSMRSIAAIKGMPSTSMMFRWLGSEKYFREQYAIAKDEQAEHMIEECNDIADNQAYSDLIIDGVPVLDPETGEPFKIVTAVGVNHARLRIDTRKWLASKLKPKKYGDKITTEHQALDKQGEPTNWQVEFVNADPELSKQPDEKQTEEGEKDD